MEHAPESPRVGLQQVVVGIDASPYAETVLEAVARLPYAQNAVIHLVHVVHWGLGYSPPTYALLERQGQAVLDRSVGALQAMLPTRLWKAVKTSLVFGTAFVEIVRSSRSLQADLVVIGRHGERRFLDALVGSTAERVVRKGTCPTLVVSRLTSRPHTRPLIGLDGSDQWAGAFTVARRLVSPDARFDVVHASESDADDDEATRSAIIDAITRHAGDVRRGEVVFRAGDPRTVVLDEARRRESDLIVLGTHGRSAIAQMLIGSVAEAVVRAAPCDVLVARSAEHPFNAV